MRFEASLILSLGVLAALANAIGPRQVDCVSGVYVVAARATDVNGTGYQDPGTLGAVADAVTEHVKNSRTQAVDYPATPDFTHYNESVTIGVDATQSMIRNYVDSCGPKSPIVVLGYSQGANVISEALSGGPLSGRPALEDCYRRNSKCTHLSRAASGRLTLSSLSKQASSSRIRPSSLAYTLWTPATPPRRES